jgi:putative transposase
MTKAESKPAIAAAKELFAQNPDGLKDLVRAVMQEVLGVGDDGRTLITRVGKLELRVPKDQDGRFSTELFERYHRSEQALTAPSAEMYVQGVSTHKAKAITEETLGPFILGFLADLHFLTLTKDYLQGANVGCRDGRTMSL